jgi:hypothetical protein
MGPHLSNLCSLSGVLQVSVNAPLLVCFAFLHFEAKFLSVFSWDMSVKNLEKKRKYLSIRTQMRVSVSRSSEHKKPE